MRKREVYLSIIFVGRNDNYGGDFKSRLQNCVSNLSEQLNRFKVPSEIIFVNYNYLSAPNILDFIEWPKSTNVVDIRIINVPNEIHQEFVKTNNVKDVPIIEYLAKNVGIRRAIGEFILCMNPDILISDKIIEFISKRKLRDNTYYRTDRFDYDSSIENKDIEVIKKKIIGIWLKGVDFKFTKKCTINKVQVLYYKALSNLIISKYNFIRLFNFIWKIPLHYKAEYKYHCNVSGDFMMLSRKIFYDIHGYYENAPISLHIDSLFVIQIASYGLKEKVFDTPIYHKDHRRRYTSNRNNDIENDAYLFFQKEAENMLKNKGNKIYSPDDWGLKGVELYEYSC